MKKHIVCCGNIAFDIIINNINSKKGVSLQVRPGGSVLNTAILLSRLGLSVSMFSKTGKDFLGDALLNILQREKLKTNHIIRDKHLKTGLAFAQIDKKGDSSYIFYKSQGEQTSFTQNEIPPDLFKKAAVFHTGSSYSYSNHTFANTIYLMNEAKEKGVFVSYDPNWRENRIQNKPEARGRIKKIIRYVDLLKLSESDALGITGAKTLPSALKKLPANIVVTLGTKGSFFWDGKRKTSHAAFRVKVVDTIGAGDALTAGLLYRYCHSGNNAFWQEKKEDLSFASAAAALVCTGRGATEGLKNLRQVYRFLQASHL